MKRRAFLQRTGLTLATLGASNFGLSILSQNYYRVLADPTPRRLALLVGINQYRNAALSGCVTDVELQQELLTHRFRFKPSDILTLTDQQATRSAIETAFVNHLVEQAKPGDVVVFHFSGYGSQVAIGSPPNSSQHSLVTVDDPVSDGEGMVVSDILEDTLLLLLRSLPTDKVTTVLDTGYTYPGKSLQGNLRIRARPSLGPVQAIGAELVFQEQLLSQANLNRDRLALVRQFGKFPGVVLQAAQPGQIATEAHWSGFSAGLFTYALTQQLWQATPATVLRVSLSRAKEQVEQWVTEEQHPQLVGQKSQEAMLLPYHLVADPLVGADGVIVGVEENSKTVRLWLAGLPPGVLEQYGSNSLLSIVEPSTPEALRSPTYLQLLSREGLVAKAKLYHPDAASSTDSSLTIGDVGLFVRERVRVLPRNIGLTLALDSSLERIERVDAISALSAIPHVSSTIAGEQAADYVFSKVSGVTQTQVAALPSALPGLVASTATNPPGSYGLFSLGQEAIPNTIGESGEAIKVAMRRLAPKLQTLLAMKLLGLTVNEGSSKLPVRVTLEQQEAQEPILLSRETVPANPTPARKLQPPITTIAELLTLPMGSRIQYRLENRGTQSIYFTLLGLDSSGNLIALYAPPGRSVDWVEKRPGSLPDTLASGETLVLPPPSALPWVLGSTTGVSEAYVVCSRAPFTQTQEILGTVLRPTNEAAALYPIPNPLEVAQAVLHDLHQASDPAAQVAGASPDTFALDVNAWASLHFVYQIA